MTPPAQSEPPRGSQGFSKAEKHVKKKTQAVIASLGADWRNTQLVYDPKLRDSRGHLKRGVRYVLDRKAGYDV